METEGLFLSAFFTIPGAEFLQDCLAKGNSVIVLYERLGNVS